MNRRTFLRTTTALSGLAALSGLPDVVGVARGQHKEFNPRPGAWRTYELATKVERVSSSTSHSNCSRSSVLLRRRLIS